jgi:hypothetical protein
MDVAGFTQLLRRLTPTDFHVIGAALEGRVATAADEVEAWRLTITVDRTLRRLRRSRNAAQAAAAATHTVLAAARADLVDLPDRTVTLVARAAAEVARALTAGDDAHYEAEALLVPFSSLREGVAAA